MEKERTNPKTLVRGLSSSRSGKIFKSCENISHALIVSLLFLTRYSENTESPRC